MDSRVVVRPPGTAPMNFGTSLFLLIAIVMGLAFIWVGVISRQQERAYATEGIETSGTVTAKAFVPGTADDPDEYKLAYGFTTLDGRRFSGVGRVSSDTYAQTDVGDQVTVSYLDSRPSTNRIGGAMPALLSFLFGAVGAALAFGGGALFVRNTLRLVRGDRTMPTPIAPRGSQSEVTYVFRRPAARILVDLLGPPIGAAMFLGGAWLIGLSGLVNADAFARVLFLVGFGFFGLLLLLAVPMGLRRGLNPALLEIGPAGIWIPEMGRLAWNEIREVRLESSLGAGGGTDVATTSYARLGIVPVDPARGEAVRRGLAWRAVDGYMDLARRLRPGARLPDLDNMAPFGIYAYELGGSLDQAVAAVERYREVVAPAMALEQAAPA